MSMTNTNNNAIITFEQIDSWFFREARPHGSVGANVLSSVFPPSTRTLMGAVRSYIGNQYFAKHPEQSWDNLNQLTELKTVIGNADSLGEFEPQGVFLQVTDSKNSTFYLPAPSNICQKTEQDKTQYLAFELTEKSYPTDIGNIPLPTLPETTKAIEDTRGFKPLENTWISTEVWQAILNADMQKLTAQSDQICSLEDFKSSEYRLGIELQSEFRSIKEGQLYQTTHLRLKPNVAVVMPIRYNENTLKQIDDKLFHQPILVRLGGEARMATVTLFSAKQTYLPTAPKKLTTAHNGKKRFMLYFITHLAIQNGQNKENGWLPQGFEQKQLSTAEQGGFMGTLNGIDMTIISACIGKAHREGGWNQLEHKPRAIENFLPVGTTFFVEVDDIISDDALIEKLHGQSVADNSWGEGLMLVGQIIKNAK